MLTEYECVTSVCVTTDSRRFYYVRPGNGEAVRVSTGGAWHTVNAGRAMSLFNRHGVRKIEKPLEWEPSDWSNFRGSVLGIIPG